MRQELCCRSLVIASALAASLASGQTTTQDNPPARSLEAEPAPTPNRLSFAYRMGFNISAKFKNIGGFPALANPGLTPNGDPWNYDNGYNLDDGAEPPPGLTWYWGYPGHPSPAGQAQVPGDGFLYLS